jgi:hypothetical protein
MNPWPTGSLDRHEDNGDRVSEILQRCNDGRSVGHDQVWRRANEFRRLSSNASGVTAQKTIVDPNVAVFGPSEREKTLSNGRDTTLRLILW